MKKNWPLYNLNGKEFEDLTVLLCQRVLGTGTVHFSAGPDGGRDAVFKGTAESFPSSRNPWTGTFIIQAKHTENPLASCSDAEFRVILNKELPKIKRLADGNEMDYYLLFTNRKLPGGQFAKISAFLKAEIACETAVIGNETIQSWLSQYGDVVKTADLNRLFLPFEFYEKDLKELILAFASTIGDIDDAIPANDTQWQFLEKEEKNQLNVLSQEYFEFIQENSLSHFDKIDQFLKNPNNSVYKNHYKKTISDLREKILIRRKEYHEFQELFGTIFEYVLKNNENELSADRDLIRVFLHYMYWNCDIGLKTRGQK